MRYMVVLITQFFIFVPSAPFSYVQLHIASVVLFKLHVCMVSHMQVLATTLLSVHNIKYSFCSTERIYF